MATISVIVPVYKVEKYLKRCIDSILAQTFQDFELILVDDGSPDNCGAICDDYAKQDPRIIAIHQENQGLSAARNAGIDWVFANSNSQWFHFIDSDDWVHPQILEKLLDANLSLGTDVSICEYIRTTSDSFEHLPIAKSPVVYTWDDLFQKSWLANYAWGKLYHRDCFQSIRYPVGKIYEDIFTTYKTLYNRSISVLWAPCYYYFIAPGSLTQAAWSPKRMDRLEALESQIRFFERINNRELLVNTLNSYLHGCIRMLFQIYRLKDHRSYKEYKRICFRKISHTIKYCIKEKVTLLPLIKMIMETVRGQ